MLVLDSIAVLDLLRREFPQSGHLDLTIERLEPTNIRVTSPVRDADLRPGGTVSGPKLMWLADVATYMLLLARLGPVTLAVTTNLNINFLRKPVGPSLTAEARLLKLGQRLAVFEVSLFAGEAPQPVAHATLTYSIPPGSRA
jgi:uncharacterized protein (TIGR00369 family)